MFWEVVFMLVILKIPVAYLCAVVWWAIRAEPEPLEGAGRLAALGPEPSEPPSGCDWRPRRRVLAGPSRGPRARRGRIAVAPPRVPA